MYLPLFLSAVFLLLLTTTSSDVITTDSTSADCHRQSQCSAEQFCNYENHSCVSKTPINSTCEHDFECIGEKCFNNKCRQPCKSDTDCSPTDEYCSISKYCTTKHCGFCTRNTQCANNECSWFFICKTSDCTNAFKALYGS